MVIGSAPRPQTQQSGLGVLALMVAVTGVFSMLGCSEPKDVLNNGYLWDDSHRKAWEFVFFEKPSRDVAIERSRLWIANAFKSHYECFIKFRMEDRTRDAFLVSRKCKELTPAETELIVHRVDSQLPDWFPTRPYTGLTVWEIQNWRPDVSPPGFEAWKAEDRVGYLMGHPSSNSYFVCVFKNDTQPGPSPYAPRVPTAR